MSTRDELVRYVIQFLEIAGSPGTPNKVSRTQFSMKVSNSPNLVTRLLSGHDVTTATYDKAVAFIDEWYIENGVVMEDTNDYA